jgi:catechol 2,3-dioxygenase-like lactoylglutathione lyase family enzyme
MKLYASHCVFPTPNIHKTAEYYVEKLGFRRADYLDAKEQHICLYRDGVEFILTKANSQRVFPNRELYGYGEDAYVITESQQELQDEFEKKGVKIVHRLYKTDYHNLEFTIEDVDGRWICFGIKQA